MSHRVEQVASALRRSVAEVLQRDIDDPRLEGALVSVTEVSVSADLRNATVKVSVLPEKAERRAVAALQHAARHIHALVKKKMALRIVPHLEFRLDETLKKQAEVFKAIHEAVERSGGQAPQDGEATANDD